MTGNRAVTKYGEIQGVIENGCVIFKGVPYAKPPVGELRFVPMERLFAIQDEMSADMMKDGEMLLAFAPVRNGVLRSRTYDEITAAGETADVPTVIGSNTNDITVQPEEAAAGMSRFQRNCVNWALEMEKNSHQPSWVYHFTRRLPGDDAGAFHSAELWYMFGTLGSCWRPMTPADYDLSERMVGYWTNFMKTGDPNGEGLAEWPSCTAEHPFEMKLDV